jgi:hypothetical protein
MQQCVIAGTTRGRRPLEPEFNYRRSLCPHRRIHPHYLLILLPDVLNVYAAWEFWRSIPLHGVMLRLAT